MTINKEWDFTGKKKRDAFQRGKSHRLSNHGLYLNYHFPFFFFFSSSPPSSTYKPIHQTNHSILPSHPIYLGNLPPTPPPPIATSTPPPITSKPKQRPTLGTIPLLVLAGSVAELGTAQMEPLARTVVVVARDHFAVGAAVAVAVFGLVRVVRVVLGAVVWLVEGFRGRHVVVVVVVVVGVVPGCVGEVFGWWRWRAGRVAVVMVVFGLFHVAWRGVSAGVGGRLGRVLAWGGAGVRFEFGGLVIVFLSAAAAAVTRMVFPTVAVLHVVVLVSFVTVAHFFIFIVSPHLVPSLLASSSPSISARRGTSGSSRLQRVSATERSATSGPTAPSFFFLTVFISLVTLLLLLITVHVLIHVILFVSIQVRTLIEGCQLFDEMTVADIPPVPSEGWSTHVWLSRRAIAVANAACAARSGHGLPFCTFITRFLHARWSSLPVFLQVSGLAHLSIPHAEVPSCVWAQAFHHRWPSLQQQTVAAQCLRRWFVHVSGSLLSCSVSVCRSMVDYSSVVPRLFALPAGSMVAGVLRGVSRAVAPLPPVLLAELAARLPFAPVFLGFSRSRSLPAVRLAAAISVSCMALAAAAKLFLARHPSSDYRYAVVLSRYAQVVAAGRDWLRRVQHSSRPSWNAVAPLLQEHHSRDWHLRYLSCCCSLLGLASPAAAVNLPRRLFLAVSAKPAEHQRMSHHLPRQSTDCISEVLQGGKEAWLVIAALHVRRCRQVGIAVEGAVRTSVVVGRAGGVGAVGFAAVPLRTFDVGGIARYESDVSSQLMQLKE
ncbi:hypothetical protein KC361_g54 [Hortaea werneckii]|nr:hypothetical protein KC361_g54 [Hortaea werneckii]